MKITPIIPEAKEILPDTCHLHFLNIKLRGEGRLISINIIVGSFFYFPFKLMSCINPGSFL